MLCRQILNRVRLPCVGINFSKRYCQSKAAKGNGKQNESEEPQDSPSLGTMARKYVPFREEDSEEILDVHEERLKYTQQYEERELEEIDPFKGLNLERGKSGVFDIEDLISVLKVENAENIFVASVPQETKYVDFICILNAKSHKHMQAIIEFVRRVYKQKRHNYDSIPLIEGAGSKDWMALDLGNIALHVFSKEARKLYDLESLWAVGREFDAQCNKKDAIVDMLEKHSIYLHKLEPAS